MQRLKQLVPGFLALLGAVTLSGCLTGAKPAETQGGGESGKTRLLFWHTRRADQEKILRSICEDYNRQNPGVEVVPEYQGSYDDLHKKIRASIQARSLPALTVAYESHVTEYMANGVVRPLDDLVQDSQSGFSAAELADIPAAYLESNRFAQFGNQLLSFPFTKSNLMLYYNASLLKRAGFEGPPRTWAEFERQAAALTRQMGKPAFAFDLDPSSLDGMIYSFGGDLLAADGQHTLFDQAPTVRMLELLQRMERGGTMARVDDDDVGPLFVGQSCALALSTSSSRAYLEKQIGDAFEWDVAVIPHAEGVEPVTVMYGPNVCVFRSTPEQEKQAWQFIRYFVSPEVTARWARETGYLPVRKSAVELEEMKEFYRKNPRAWHVYQVLPLAKGEPNVVGWQEVRSHLSDAAAAVISGAAPRAQALELKQKADRALAQSQR